MEDYYGFEKIRLYYSARGMDRGYFGKILKNITKQSILEKIWFDCSDDWIFSALLHFSNSCSNEIYSFSDMA